MDKGAKDRASAPPGAQVVLVAGNGGQVECEDRAWEVGGYRASCGCSRSKTN